MLSMQRASFKLRPFFKSHPKFNRAYNFSVIQYQENRFTSYKILKLNTKINIKSTSTIPHTHKHLCADFLFNDAERTITWGRVHTEKGD